MFGKNILILAPHPDDEVVASCATIGRAQAQGAKIFVLFLTHGCIAEGTMWAWDRKNYQAHVARRRREGEEAARFLGLTPVGWVQRPARHVWREMPAVYEEIKAAVAVHAIDQLWVPAYEGGNADHDAVNALGSLFKHLSVLEFAEYNFCHRRAQSNAFPKPNGSEQTIAISLAEQQKKRAALAIYESEKNNLGYVKTKRECRRVLADYDYCRPPHDGTLWYARFQWVPFRHPRVDFANPADVSMEIIKFLKSS